MTNYAGYFSGYKAAAKRAKVTWPTAAQFDTAFDAISYNTKRARPGTMKHLAAAIMLGKGATMRRVEAVTGDTHHDAARALAAYGATLRAVPAVDGHKVYAYDLKAAPKAAKAAKAAPKGKAKAKAKGKAKAAPKAAKAAA